LADGMSFGETALITDSIETAKQIVALDQPVTSSETV